MFPKKIVPRHTRTFKPIPKNINSLHLFINWFLNPLIPKRRRLKL
jgi:hypothetical protein